MKFSVAMCVYGKDDPRHFKTALESIVHQTLPPDELVLVEDGPVTHEIEAAVEEAANEYTPIHVIRLEKNVGLGNALRIAVENCRCDLIARMDSDDIALRDRFEQQIRYFEDDPSLDILGGDITEFVGDEDHIVARRVVPRGNDEIRSYIRKRCPFNHMTVMFKKNAVISAGNYVDWFWNEDYFLWIRMYERNCRMKNTGTTLVNVRTGKEMYKRRGGKRYFESELALQRYMLSHGIITYPLFIANVLKRYIVQRAMPNSLRGVIFKAFAREKAWK